MELTKVAQVDAAVEVRRFDSKTWNLTVRIILFLFYLSESSEHEKAHQYEKFGSREFNHACGGKIKMCNPNSFPFWVGGGGANLRL